MQPGECVRRGDPLVTPTFTLARCNLLCTLLGWTFSVTTRQCTKCLDGRTVSPARVEDTAILRALAGMAAGSRLRAGNLTQWQRCREFKTFRKAAHVMKRLGVPKNEIAHNMLYGVRNGIPAAHAIEVEQEL